MAKDYTQLPPTHMRRNDRQVEDEAWIKALLHRAAVGSLATAHDDQPFINMNLFVYDEVRGEIYVHTARTGRLVSNLAHNDRICFAVQEMGRLLPADVALEFSVEYKGVIVFGRGEVIEEDAEATRALQLLLDKYAPHLSAGVDYRPPVVEELKRTATFRLVIEDWTGKQKQVAADFPGAYWYEAVRQ